MIMWLISTGREKGRGGGENNIVYGSGHREVKLLELLRFFKTQFILDYTSSVDKYVTDNIFGKKFSPVKWRFFTKSES